MPKSVETEESLAAQEGEVHQDASIEEVSTEEVNTEEVNTEEVNTEEVNTEEVNTEEVEVEQEASTPSPEEQMAQMKQAYQHLEDQVLRGKAEVENIRRRANDDVVKARRYALEKFSSELLTVKDSLELALQHEQSSVEVLKQGVELTQKQLCQVFEKFGLKELFPLGQAFNPEKHQAVGSVQSDKSKNEVVEVLQKGYLLEDRILRPALVKVSTGENSSKKNSPDDLKNS